MTLLLRLKRLVFSLWNRLLILSLIPCCSCLNAQQLAAYHDNQGRFFIFDDGKIIQAEYLPVQNFSVGGRCILYTDNRNNLKMYYQGNLSTLEVNNPGKFEALDYLSV